LGFLFVEEVRFSPESQAALDDPSAQSVIGSALAALESINEWRHEEIEAALRAALIEKMSLKPRVAFSPVRIAVTGSHISPPLFESMALLGKERSLARLRAAIK